LLDNEGIDGRLQNEALGMIAPHHFPAGAGVRVLIAREDLEKARTDCRISIRRNSPGFT